MKSVYNFVIEPVGQRYNNKKSIGDKELILNTEVFNHEYVNRLAKVISCPIIGDSMGIEPGDLVIVHHNVFRRWHDVRGVERNSKAYFNENTYIVYKDQIFLYNRDNKWLAPKGYCFVKPVKATNKFNTSKEKPLTGIVEYTDGTVSKGDLVGFRPNSEYEFIIDNQLLYRVYSHFITIKYEHKGNEEAYNPSWA